jgi:hypothetical protein
MAKAELTLAIFALAAIICPMRSRGQEPNSSEEARAAVAEPEYVGVFFRLDAGRLIPLERQEISTRVRTTGILMAYNMTSVSEFDGAKSPVRFGGVPLEFVVRTSPILLRTDPQSEYHLRFLATKKKVRQMIGLVSRISPLGASVDTRGQGLIPVTFERYGSSSMKLKVGSLPPGEYALTTTLNPLTVFCFGVNQ